MLFVLEKEILKCYNPFQKKKSEKYEMAKKPLKGRFFRGFFVS